MASREEAELQDLMDLFTYLYSKKKKKKKIGYKIRWKEDFGLLMQTNLNNLCGFSQTTRDSHNFFFLFL